MSRKKRGRRGKGKKPIAGGTCTQAGGESQVCLRNSPLWVDPMLYCYDGLSCINDVCVSAGGEGEPCIPAGTADNPYSSDQCNYGLICMEGTCRVIGTGGMPCFELDGVDDQCSTGFSCVDDICVADLPDEVGQPGTNRFWKRCPVGIEWTGRQCEYTIYSYDTYYWETAQSQCPAGYRLPTVREMISLLAECDDDVLTVYFSECASCSESPICHEMFDRHDGVFWTSTQVSSSDIIGDEYWAVHFGGGYVMSTTGTTLQSIRCMREE